MLGRRVVARPSFSKHEEEFEKAKQIPVGTFRRFAEVENGAIQRVLDGKLGTTEGGSALLAEFFAEGVNGCETLTPMDLTAQIRRIIEAALVEEDMEVAIKRLRLHGLTTGMLCYSWSGAGKSISVPERSRLLKRELESSLSLIVESKHLRAAGANVAIHRNNPDFYRIAAEQAGMDTSELIYVDSRMNHLEPAQTAGMKAVNCKFRREALQELQDLLQVEMPGAENEDQQPTVARDVIGALGVSA